MRTKTEIFNPCRSPDLEIIPAKLWELIRRNEVFITDAKRFLAIEDKTEQKNFKNEINHPFAEKALEWMLPAHNWEDIFPEKEHNEIKFGGAHTASGPILLDDVWEEWQLSRVHLGL